MNVDKTRTGLVLVRMTPHESRRLQWILARFVEGSLARGHTMERAVASQLARGLRDLPETGTPEARLAELAAGTGITVG